MVESNRSLSPCLEQMFRLDTMAASFSVKVTPKNVGAKGIKAPKTNIIYKPGWSEEEGNFADLTFEILFGEQDYWYSRFTKAAAAGG